MKQIEMDHMYMDFAVRVSQNSRATRKKVGCVIVKDDNVIAYGWNGTAKGEDNCCEDENGVTKEGVIHAEHNAIIKLARSGNSSEDSTVYLTMQPCEKCAAMLIQAGVKRVVYFEAYRLNTGVDMLKKSKQKIHVDKLKYKQGVKMQKIEKVCSLCGETIKKGEFVLESSVQEKTFMCMSCATRAKNIIDKS